MSESDVKAERVALLKSARSIRARCHERDVAPDSHAALELSRAAHEMVSDQPVRRVVFVVDLWTLISVDQLHSLGVLYEAGDSVFGFFPVVRSILEHTAACKWVLDNEEDTPVRAARAAVYQLHSAGGQVTAIAHMSGKGGDAHRAAKATLDELRAQVKVEFPNDTTIEPIKVNGVERLRATDVVKGLGGTPEEKVQWGGMYDYLCCTANHPNLTVADFFAQADDGQVACEIDGVFAGKLLRAACCAFNEAMRYVVSYCGWPAEALDEFSDGIDKAFPVEPDQKV